MFIWFPFFRFLTNEISDNSDMALIVRVDCESVPTVKFSKGEELPKLLLIENHSIEVGLALKPRIGFLVFSQLVRSLAKVAGRSFD